MFLVVAMGGLLGTGAVGTIERSTLFIGFYLVIRLVLAGMFLTAAKDQEGAAYYTRAMTITILLGAGIAALSLAFGGIARQIVFLGGIAFEMVASVTVSHRAKGLSVHREHLVERVGLLGIILLGESIISMVGGLRGMEWDGPAVTAAITGFVMLCAIWWIYFDSFDSLEKATRLEHGFVLLYTQVLFLLGLGVLANVVGHAIRGSLGYTDFCILLVAGMSLFYLGKQITYYSVFPPYRFNIVVNSMVCIGVTIAGTLTGRIEYALIAATAGMLFYTWSNVRWTLTKDATAYQEA